MSVLPVVGFRPRSWTRGRRKQGCVRVYPHWRALTIFQSQSCEGLMKATNLLLWKTHECTNLSKPAYSFGGHPWTLQRIVMLWSVCALVCLRQHFSSLRSSRVSLPVLHLRIHPQWWPAGLLRIPWLFWLSWHFLFLRLCLDFPPYLRIPVMWVMWSVPPTCLTSVLHDPGESPGGQVYWTMWKWNAALSQNPAKRRAVYLPGLSRLQASSLKLLSSSSSLTSQRHGFHLLAPDDS